MAKERFIFETDEDLFGPGEHDIRPTSSIRRLGAEDSGSRRYRYYRNGT